MTAETRQHSRSFVISKYALAFFGVIAVTSIPSVIISLIWWPGFVGIATLGGLISTTAMMMATWRVSLLLNVLASILAGAAVLVHPYPIVGALLMAALGALTGFSARRGLHSPVMMVPLIIGFLLVSPPPLFSTTTAPTLDASYALGIGVAVLVGGLWATLVFYLMRSRLPKPQLQQTEELVAHIYGAGLAITLGVATFVILTWFSGGFGAWLLLTILVLMQPEKHATFSKTIARVSGTVIGIFLAGLFVTLIGAAALHYVVGLVLVFIALLEKAQGSYARFTMLLTPAIVLFDSVGRDGYKVAESRLVFTVVGAALVIVVSVILDMIVRARSQTA